MYENFYGFTEKPFTLLPDPSFLYLGDKHSTAYAMLEYGLISQAGFSVITGEVGSGKTTLIRHLLNRLEEDVSVGLVSSSHRDMGELLRWVLLAFGLDYRETEKVALHDLFTQFLIDQYAQNKRTVLIVDEAQNLQAQVLEELRLLSNINADKHQVLQIILVGQPQLREFLRHEDLLQFQQRVSVDYHLSALSEEETRAYIFHRTRMAGRSKPLFTRGASTLIYRASQGIPRVINTLCDAVLVYGFADQVTLLDSKLVIRVLEDKAEARRIPGQDPSDVKARLKPVVVAGAHEGSSQPRKGGRRITDFNRDAAKLLFNKYYNDK
ncbi:MAG: AAA family ATPase [Candidatus Thiodiazotropha sp.]|jgi:general secretion pathway protein A